MLDNWINLSNFFEYGEHACKTIYNTNPIEVKYLKIGKIMKSKGSFNSEQAIMKLMFLLIKDISKKWTMPVHNLG